MIQLQLIFDEIAEKKQRGKELLELYKNSLNNNSAYCELRDSLASTKEAMKLIEEDVQAKLGSSYEQFEEIKRNIKTELQTMTDLAINDLMEGKTVMVKDSFERKYEPVWSVRFKKAN